MSDPNTERLLANFRPPQKLPPPREVPDLLKPIPVLHGYRKAGDYMSQAELEQIQLILDRIGTLEIAEANRSIRESKHVRRETVLLTRFADRMVKKIRKACDHAIAELRKESKELRRREAAGPRRRKPASESPGKTDQAKSEKLSPGDAYLKSVGRLKEAQPNYEVE